MQDFIRPEDSDITLSVVMHPEDTNVAGNIFGGKILALMDQAAYACACKHARAPTVTASVNTVNFLTPIYVGDLVTIKARVNYVGSSSMVVGIRVEAENLIEGHVRHSNSSYFTMVAMEDGKPKPVPGLLLENIEDVRRFVRSHQRRVEQKERMAKYTDKAFALDKEQLDWYSTQNVKIADSLLETFTK